MATFHQVNARNLQCSMCLSTFKQPKSLVCSHTFCKGCLQTFLEYQPGGKTLPCPVCRKQTPLPSGDVSDLQTNIPLQSLVDDIITQNPVCSNCNSEENPTAVSYCQDCHKNMCVSCDKEHSLRPPFTAHGVVVISDVHSEKVSMKRRQKCKKHTNEDEEYFCSKCRKYICVRCGMQEHQHDGQRIVEALVQEEKLMTNIRDLTEQAEAIEATLREHSALIDAQQAKVIDIIEYVEENIDQAFKDYIRQLEERRAALKDELRQISERLKGRLVAMAGETKKNVNHIQVMTGLVANGSKIPLEKDALSAHETLCENLKCVLGREDPTNKQLEAVGEQAKRISFRRNRGMNELGLGVLSECEFNWDAKADVGLPDTDSMNCMTATPDGRMAVGCAFKRGIHLYSSDGELQKTVLKDVSIRALGFLSDGQCVVIDTSNKITLYTPGWESKPNVVFESLGTDEGGVSNIAVDNDDLIFVSYRKPQEIHVFTRDGGKPIRTIPCGRYLLMQIFLLQSQRKVILRDPRKVVCLDSKQGSTTNDVTQPPQKTKQNKNGYPAVCRDDSVIVAWVNHDDGIVSIDRYTSQLECMKSLISDHKIEKSHKRNWYYLQEFRSGEIAFCTTDRLYIFKKSYI